MDISELVETSKGLENEGFTSTLTSVLESNTAMNKQIESLTGDRNKAVKKRDSLATLIKGKFNLEEFSEEALDDAIQGLGKRGTEDLKKALADNEGRYKADLTTANGKISQAQLDLAIYKTGALSDVQGKPAKEVILNALKNGATVENGELVYYDGETLLLENGQPMTINDRLKSIKDNADYDTFFHKKNKRGGGKKQDGDTADLTTKPKTKFGTLADGTASVREMMKARGL